MGFLIAYLLGVLTAVRGEHYNRKHIDSEPNKSNCNPPPDRPLTVVSIPPTPTDQERTMQEKKERHEAITFWVGIATLIVLAVYAGFTIAVWWETKKQVDILQRSWVKLSEETIVFDKPQFSPSGSPKDYPPTEPSSSTAIEMNHEFKIENFGHLPARRYYAWAQVFYSETGVLNDVYDAWEPKTCEIARGNLDGVQHHDVPFTGKVIFPGSATVYAGSYAFAPNTIHHIRELYVGVCLIYEDVGGDLHRTAVLYCQDTSGPDNPIKVLDKPEMWWHHPTAKFESCDADAD